MNKLHTLVEVKAVIPTINLDIKYATLDNLTQKIIYPTPHCYLIDEAAHALKAASDEFKVLGYFIKIWDCYRPLNVQQILWEVMPDERYVAHPDKGSRHNRGCAIDLKLTDVNGVE